LLRQRICRHTGESRYPARAAGAKANKPSPIRQPWFSFALRALEGAKATKAFADMSVVILSLRFAHWIPACAGMTLAAKPPVMPPWRNRI
jgi:hypothetical protein